MKKIRVLIIDDSAVVRQTLTSIFATDKKLEVIATASDPFVAAKKIKAEVPDVITLDIEMPKMDGITFLKKLMSQHPVPVVVISTLTEHGTATALKALEYGAVEVLAKPRLNTEKALKESSIILCDTVKAAASVHVQRIKTGTPLLKASPKLNADVILSKKSTMTSMLKTTDKVVVIGASTGGTKAIKVLLQSLPLDCPGVIIVQHMPEIFTKQFAKRLDQECGITVKEASHGDRVLRGHALIAPGSHHMLLKRSGAQYFVELKDGPLVSRHKPSADVLFRSAARYAGKNAVGIILTGMGDDGAKGLLEMKEAGAYTIAQDEQSCVVFGMPKEAIMLNAHAKILDLSEIGKEIVRIV